jgi:hypothetical protein
MREIRTYGSVGVSAIGVPFIAKDHHGPLSSVHKVKNRSAVPVWDYLEVESGTQGVLSSPGRTAGTA